MIFALILAYSELMSRLGKRAILPILWIASLMFSCERNNEITLPEYSYQMPEQLDDGWAVSSLQMEGLDTEIIEKLTRQIMAKEFQGIHSLLIVKNGKLVHESYFEDFTRSSLQTTYSITKSISSALIGIAIDSGMIQSVNDTVISFFPEYSIQDPIKKNIRLSHLLTLTSGLEWDEKSYPYSDPRNTETKMVGEEDWMKFVLDQPMRTTPGIEWVYNTGSVHLLSGIIKHASGMYADVFAEQFLFKPLGIQNYEWNRDPQGFPCTGGTQQGLRLTSRDVAKFGYVFLNDGKWDKLEVISKAWVEESTRIHMDVRSEGGFGYLWWTGVHTVNGETVPHYFAAGYGGQTIHIAPELDLMIVFTCWDEAQDADIFLPIVMIYSAIQ